MTSAMQAVWPARSSIACAQGVHAAPRVLDTWAKVSLVMLIALAFSLFSSFLFASSLFFSLFEL